MTKKYYKLKLDDNDAFARPPYIDDDNAKPLLKEDFESRLWYVDDIIDGDVWWLSEPKLFSTSMPIVFSPFSTLIPIDND